MKRIKKLDQLKYHFKNKNANFRRISKSPLIYGKIKGIDIHFENQNGNVKLNDKETNAIDAFKEIVGNEEIDSSILKLCADLFSSKYYSMLLEKCGILRSMLNMGIRESILQMNTTKEIMSGGFENYLKECTKMVDHLKEVSLSSKILLWSSLYPFYCVIMLPRLQKEYSELTNWYKAIINENDLNVIFENYDSSCKLCGDRRNDKSVQIDILPDGVLVGKMADVSISLNEGYKKKIEVRKVDKSQQQQQQQQQHAPACPAAVEKKETTKLPNNNNNNENNCDANEEITVEEPVNEEEKRSFELMDKLHISHSTIRHESLCDIETLLKVLDQSKGIPTKNLLLKAKKALNGEDSGIWIVVANANTNIDMNKLTKKLGYKSGSLRFANEDLLKSLCGVTHGHLSLFALMNDTEKKCQLIVDESLLKCDKISLHPLINTSSAYISEKAFECLVHYFRGDNYKVMNFNEL